LSLWDYPIRCDRECGASCAPGRNCVDLRDRVGARPSRDDLVCWYCGKLFEPAFEAAARAIRRAEDDLNSARIPSGATHSTRRADDRRQLRRTPAHERNHAKAIEGAGLS
jgi:hypothetical protein